MDTIGVIGAGQMGSGIAQTVAQHGFRVLLSDVDLAAAERGKGGIDKALTRLVSRGKLEAVEVAQVEVVEAVLAAPGGQRAARRPNHRRRLGHLGAAQHGGDLGE